MPAESKDTKTMKMARVDKLEIYIMPKGLITFPKLTADLNVDVVIIGGGMAGISSAYMLAQSGKKVVVLEGKTIGSGATGKTTGFITQVIDTSMTDMVGMFGMDKAKQVWRSHGVAMDTIERIVKIEKIDCSFTRCSYYQYALNEDEWGSLQKEYTTLTKLGITAKVNRGKKLCFPNNGYLEIPNQAKFNAEKYIHALADRATQKGVNIFEDTLVTKILGTTTFRIMANRQTVTAKQIIIATYEPFGNPKPIRLKKGMYTSYVFELQIPKGIMPEAIYQDMNNPYHYFRIDTGKQFDSMVVGGEDNRAKLKMDPRKDYKALKQYVKKIFPDLEYVITARWNGPILEPTDGLPLIGKVTPNQYVATAFSGNGMTYSMISALIFNELLQAKKSSWKKLYEPTRISTLKQVAKKL